MNIVPGTYLEYWESEPGAAIPVTRRWTEGRHVIAILTTNDDGNYVLEGHVDPLDAYELGDLCAKIQDLDYQREQNE